MYTFDKNVPTPMKGRRKHDFSGMEIGDSFVGESKEAGAFNLWCAREGWTLTRRAIKGEPGKWRFWRIS